MDMLCVVCQERACPWCGDLCLCLCVMTLGVVVALPDFGGLDEKYPRCHSGFSQQSRVSAGFGGRLEAAGTIPDIPTRVDRSGEKSGPKVPMWDPFKMDILARYSTAKHIPVSSVCAFPPPNCRHVSQHLILAFDMFTAENFGRECWWRRP